MQKMDCCNFKDLLDSYLCQELAVETNHAMLSHAEHCPSCRLEMASRRNLRQVLRQACAGDRMSDEACERLRALLREDAAATKTLNAAATSWRERWARFFNLRLAAPMTAAAAILVLLAGGVMLSRLQRDDGINGQIAKNPSFGDQAPPPLSDALMADAAADHQMCVRYVRPESQSAGMPESVKNFDEACVGLEQFVADGKGEWRLCAAHVCDLEDGRQFAHLIYKRNEQMVSLLVTPRDASAMKTGQLIPFNPSRVGLQESQQGRLAVGAYQTAKRVVLVVSNLPDAENTRLAEVMALPVVAHFRRAESQKAFLNLSGMNLIANLRGGELR